MATCLVQMESCCQSLGMISICLTWALIWSRLKNTASASPPVSVSNNLIALIRDSSTFHTFYAGDGKTRHLNVTTRFAPEYYHHDDWRSMVFEKVVDVVCDGVKGYGIAEWLYRWDFAACSDLIGDLADHWGVISRCDKPCPVPPKQSTTLLKEPASVQEPYLSALTLPFTELACCSSQLVGGKGCQLAFLTQMQGPKVILSSVSFCFIACVVTLSLPLASIFVGQCYF